MSTQKAINNQFFNWPRHLRLCDSAGRKNTSFYAKSSRSEKEASIFLCAKKSLRFINVCSYKKKQSITDIEGSSWERGTRRSFFFSLCFGSYPNLYRQQQQKKCCKRFRLLFAVAFRVFPSRSLIFKKKTGMWVRKYI